METQYAKVAQKGYTYRGQDLPKGTVVLMSKDLFDRTQRVKPPNFEAISEAEGKKARHVVQLAMVKPANDAEARPAKPPTALRTEAKQ